MALVVKDRVRDTTATTGTGTITLDNASPSAYQPFSVLGDGNQTFYCIESDTQWEVGIGTYTLSGHTLSRTTVLASSNAGALVNFSAGSKRVFVTLPAAKVGGQVTTFEYVATAGQTSFSGADAHGVTLAYTVGSLIATLNGVRLRPGDDYTATDGATFVLTSGAALNDELVIDAFSTFDVANAYTKAEADAKFVPKTSVPVQRRQTVIAGSKDSNGFPNFLSAGSGLRIALAASASTLAIAFADGLNGDYVSKVSANSSDIIGANIPASTRAFIHADYSTPTGVTWGQKRKAPQYGTKLDRAALGSILHFEAADGSTSIIDDYGHAWTAAGNAQIDTAQSSVGASSLLLGGTGDYIFAANAPYFHGVDPSTGAFTIRGKVRFAVLPTTTYSMVLVRAFNSGVYGLLLDVFNNAGTYQLRFYGSSNGTTDDINAGSLGTITPAINTWYDFALVYDDVSGHYRAYWNGVQIGSVASTARICPVTNFRWGYGNASGGLNGWLDECVIEPYCLYPAGTTFTPPTTAFGVNGHWYDTDLGVMYEVTSASASAGVNPGLTARQRVFVGEAIAGASSISSVVNYAFQGRYDSGLFAVVNNTQYVKSHNLGVVPRLHVNTAVDPAGLNERPNVSWSSDGTNSTGHYFRDPTSRTVATLRTATTFVGMGAGGTRTAASYYRILADRGF